MSDAHACPCCGHRTLSVAPSSWLTCPVCYWIDAPAVTPGEQDALFVAQRSYRAIGAASADWLGAVRAPLPDEAPHPAWRPMDGVEDIGAPSPRERASAELVARIERAFADVPAAGRVPLRAAYRADYRGDEPDSDWDDRDTDWRQIPSDVLEYFAGRTNVFVFGNAESFRYYLPAYMRHALRTGQSSTAVGALDLPLPPGTDPASLERVAALAAEQRETVAAFLRFVVDHDGTDAVAARAFDRIWAPVTVERGGAFASRQEHRPS